MAVVSSCCEVFG